MCLLIEFPARFKAKIISRASSFLSHSKAGTVRVTIILAVLVFCFFQNAYSLTPAAPSLIILPPANKTAAASLDWLSAGIQDTMTVDLWSVSAVRTRAMTEYGSLMNYNLKRMSTLDASSAVTLAKEAQVDHVWRGEYSLADKDTIVLTCWAHDSKNGALLARQEIKGPLNDVASIVSRMTMALISSTGIPVTELELGRIAKAKTTSFKAYEQNAIAFGIQISQFIRQGHVLSGKGVWIEHCQNAVALDPAYAEAYINLGWALYSDHSSGSAFKAFSTAVTLKPYLLDGWMGLGYIHRDRGNKRLSADAFQKAAALNSNLEWPGKELISVIAVAPPVKVQAESIQLTAAILPEQYFDSMLTPDEKNLLGLVEHKSPEIRMEAIKGLAQSRGRQSMPFLKQMINKPDQAFEVLKLMVDIDVSESAPYLIETLEKHITPDGSRLSGLTDQNILGVIQLVRRRSFLKQVTPVLIELLADKNAAIRESAALTLGDLGQQESIEPLRKFAVAEQTSLARMSALVSLTKLGDAAARETLRSLFSAGVDINAINYATKLMKQRNLRINEK